MGLIILIFIILAINGIFIEGHWVPKLAKLYHNYLIIMNGGNYEELMELGPPDFLKNNKHTF